MKNVFIKVCREFIYKYVFIVKKMAEGELGGQKHSTVRPQGGQGYSYKAL